ncbi:MAG: outer membrane protein assembly factor BamA [Candidatus Binatia bacterium]
MLGRRPWYLFGVFVAGLLLPGYSWGKALPGIGRPIVVIEFQCAAPIDEKDLRRLIPLHVGDSLRLQDLEEATHLLKETDLFASISIEPQPRPTGVGVVIHLVRQPIVTAIRFWGNEALGNARLERIVRLREGAPLTDELRDYAVTRIREAYRAQGFDAVQVAASTRGQGPGEVEVNFRIKEGKPLRVRTVTIDGPAPVAVDVIRAAIGIQSGDRYVPSTVRAARHAVVRLLRGQHYFEAAVETRWQRRSGKLGDLRFSIAPGPRFVVSFSGNHHFRQRHLVHLMDLRKRPIITDGTWRELARRVHRAYQEDGYYFAKVDVRIIAGATKTVRFHVSEGRVFRVAKITFQGNRGLSTRRLLDAMATRPPSWLPPRSGVLLDEVLQGDLKRLWFLYRRRGFQSAEIREVRTRFDREDGQIFLTVVIDEGPQTIVRRIEREGMTPILRRMPKLTVKVGEPLNPEAVEADRQAFVTAFASAGYVEATVAADVHVKPDGAGKAAIVSFDAIPGEQQRVGKIVVRDNFDTRSRVILRELPFRQGDVFDPDALLRGQSNIYSLGLFRRVTVRPLHDGAKPKSRDIGVTISERVPGSLQWGGGYNTRDGFRGFLEVGYKNLQGLGRSVNLRGEFNFDPSNVAPNEYIGNVGFREPRLFDTKWSLRSNIIGQRSTRTVDQFSLERFAFVPAIERSLFPGLKVGAELQVEQAQIFDVARDVLLFNPRDEGRLRTISVGPFLVYDGRDDAFVPHRGVFDSLRLRYAPAAFGSDIPFIKLLGQHSQYVPLSHDLTFVYVLRGGWAHNFQGGQQVPIRERFFLGGRSTVRGFGENAIGPEGSQIVDALGRVVDRGGDPLGGDLVLNANAELRFPLLYGFGGAVFADGGGVYLQDRSLRADDFRRSTGLGLRYVTPVGPVRLDYGFKLDRRSGESVGEVHFSIGTIF